MNTQAQQQKELKELAKIMCNSTLQRLNGLKSEVETNGLAHCNSVAPSTGQTGQSFQNKLLQIINDQIVKNQEALTKASIP